MTRIIDRGLPRIGFIVNFLTFSHYLQYNLWIKTHGKSYYSSSGLKPPAQSTVYSLQSTVYSQQSTVKL